MIKKQINSSKTFLENNVKQVVYAALTDLEWLKKNMGNIEEDKAIKQIESTVNTLAKCLDDIDMFILKK